jgi:hypothetical protein
MVVAYTYKFSAYAKWDASSISANGGYNIMW